MTDKQFFLSIEGYYGKYPQRPILKQEIAAYIKTIPIEELEGIFAYLIYNVSTQYGFTPDVAVIEEARKEIWAIQKSATARRLRLPDPLARSMKVEMGDTMKGILAKVSLRRQREKKEKEKVRG